MQSTHKNILKSHDLFIYLLRFNQPINDGARFVTAAREGGCREVGRRQSSTLRPQSRVRVLSLKRCSADTQGGRMDTETITDNVCVYLGEYIHGNRCSVCYKSRTSMQLEVCMYMGWNARRLWIHRVT